MLRRLAAVAAWLVLLAASPTGSLYVTTLPSGADVWIDGTYVGRTPLVVGALATGRHTLGITKTGWDPLQLDVSVVASQTTISSTKLDAARGAFRAGAGAIAVHGGTAGTVFIDGAKPVRAKDGTFPVAAGTHELAMHTARGRITREVMVWPQTRTDVVIQPDVEAARPSVVAPAEDYVPRSAIHVDGERLSIRYAGHDVSAHMGIGSYRVDGKPVDYGAAPTMIGKRLYLPLDLLTLLSSGTR